jgi:tetratricopeptide (TPR) repeat protein
VLLLLALLAVPSPAAAQREPFFSAVVAFYRSLAGLYGDEGPQLTAQVEAMSAALDHWDRQIGTAEDDLRSRLQSAADAQTKLQIHTTLASLYVERGRWNDAVRELDADISVDPQRAAFHRLKGVVLQAASRDAEAADAFRDAWLRNPDEPQDAYRLIIHAPVVTTPQEIDRARAALADLERRLVRRERAGAAAPFTNVRGILDDAGGMAFVPAAYASGFASILQGELERGVAQLRAAIARDPLLTDPASRSEPMVRGVAALRQGAVDTAIESLQTAVANTEGSSEAHRMLATALLIAGNVVGSVQHLRDAVRLNPRDERSRLALAHTLTVIGHQPDAEAVLRAAVAELPDASALHWRLSTRSQAAQDHDDLALIDMADRLVLLVGKGELYRALAGLAQLHLNETKAIALLERAVRLAPNNAAAHKAMGRAYIENGREAEGYAELVIALLLNPDDVETLTALGRWHLMATPEERRQGVPGDTEQRRPGVAGDPKERRQGVPADPKERRQGVPADPKERRQGVPADTAERSEGVSIVRAVDALERAVSIDPANRLAIHALAGALIRAGRATDGAQRLRESERLQAQAIEDDRRAKTAAVLRLSAEMRMAAADHAGAVDIWRQAILLQPGNAPVHLRLAEALSAAGRLDEAAAEYLEAISLDAGADAHRRLAELYASMGRNADAVRERTAYTERRLNELRQRAAEGAYGF